MIAFFLLALLGGVFYLFIGFGPEEAIKIMLVLMWGLMLMSAIVGPFTGY